MNIQRQITSSSWKDCPESVRNTVNNILAFYRQVLGENLTGFYLHGSLVMGCFNPGSSDIDFLAVVHRKLTVTKKKAIIDFLLGIGDVHTEMSIVTLDNAKNIRHPTPFELHYNYDHREQYENGTIDLSVERCDEDLVMHYLAIQRRGICLYGRPIDEVFPGITREICIPSIGRELDWIAERIDSLPVTYVALNPCRALAFLRAGTFMSKKEGGEWALFHLPPKFSTLINRALAAYSGAGEVTSPEQKILKKFVDYTRKEFRRMSAAKIVIS